MGRKYFNILILVICVLLTQMQPANADPVTLTLVGWGMSQAMAATVTNALIYGAVLGVVSTAIAVPTSIVSAQQQKAQADYMAEVNNVNAASARSQAQAKIQQQRIQSRFLQGQQLAKLGSMGVTADSGSTLMLLGQTAGQEKYDELVTEWQGETQSISFQNQAALNEYQGDVAQWNLGLDITSSAVKGFANGAMMGASGGSLLTGTTKSLGTTDGAAIMSTAGGLA